MGGSESPVGHPTVLDNTMLSNFALVQHPDVSLRLWPGHVYTTPVALGEYLAAGEERHLQPDCWNDLPVLELTAKDEEFANQLLTKNDRCRLPFAYRKAWSMRHSLL